MVCPYCRSPNEGGQTHCSSCGGPLSSSGGGERFSPFSPGRYGDNGKNPYAQKDLGSLKNPYAQKDLGGLRNPYSEPADYRRYPAYDPRNPYDRPMSGRGYSAPVTGNQNPYDTNPYANPPYDRNYSRGRRRYRGDDNGYGSPDGYYDNRYGAPPPPPGNRFGRGMADTGAAFMYAGFSVGWYYLLIYFVLFVSAVISLATLPFYLTGACFGKNAETWFSLYPQLHTWIYIYAGIRAFIAVWAILTRMSLAHHSRYAPLMLHFLYLLNIAAPLLFMPVAYGLMGSEFSVGEAFGAIHYMNYVHSGLSLLILFCNIPYFIKRRSVFTH